MANITRFDAYLADSGPAALVLREDLVSVEGKDGVVFPPTFASGDDFPGGYNIDIFQNGESVCLIDSVGSQANRIEPLFSREGYATLVPQVTIKAGDRVINLLEAGHRAGDAIVRCTALQEDIRSAFKALKDGDATAMAAISPTSLVFGVWDSRDTQVKAPRLLASTIRAFNVLKLRRSAQYNPATEYVAAGLLEEPTDAAAKKVFSERGSERGFQHVPASASHGGIIAKGGIHRDMTLSLAALRLLRAGKNNERTQALRRYLFGLAATAFTADVSPYLRQGCNLVLDGSKANARVIEEVFQNGSRKQLQITHQEALEFAKEAGRAFGVGNDRSVEFDRNLAKLDLTAGDEKKAKSKKAKS